MNLDLTHRDCEQLLQCLDAWEDQPNRDGFSGMLLGTMLGKMSGMSKDESKSEIMKEHAVSVNATRRRKEEAVFLRAKLLQLRNRLQEREPVQAEA